MSRLFHLTFYLEDDTLAIYEENIRNSGVVGGYYLKRGAYLNELPSEIAQATSSSSPTAPPAHGSADDHGQENQSGKSDARHGTGHRSRRLHGD